MCTPCGVDMQNAILNCKLNNKQCNKNNAYRKREKERWIGVEFKTPISGAYGCGSESAIYAFNNSGCMSINNQFDYWTTS